jgi:hypothetical protein
MTALVWTLVAVIGVPAVAFLIALTLIRRFWVQLPGC